MFAGYQQNRIIVLASIAIAMLLLGGFRFNSGRSRSRGAAVTVGAEQSAVVTYKLLEYVPSAWENEWVANVDAIHARDAICSAMLQSPNDSSDWLAGVKACEQFADCSAYLPRRVFSKFVRECTLSNSDGRTRRPMTVTEYIEPLVGHMRHPYALARCLPKGFQDVDIQDRSYLMLLGDDARAVRARYPGRAILFDAGTSTFASSLGYLLPAYSAAGIEFDAIYAWEADAADPIEYWASVPDSIKQRLHFYNAPVTPTAGSPMNPVDWIKKIYRPGDFIVFKLDIDDDDVESVLIQQVLELDDAGDIIAEMFFEKHYTATDMLPAFGETSTDYPAAVRLLQALRMKGLRVHYWP